MSKKTDPRYRFVRARNIFDGLDDYFKSRPINLVNRVLEYPMDRRETNDFNKKIGDYFEFLVQGIYGGMLREQYYPNENNLLIEPDLINISHKNIFESKSVFAGEVLKIEDFQLAKYIYLQKVFKNKESNKYPIITYEISKHRVSKLSARFKNKPLEFFVGECSKNILSYISLPLSVISKIHLSEKDKNFISRGGENWHSTYTSLTSTGLNLFIAYPEEALSRIKLNPEDYIIKKRKFPKTITMNSKNINSFPVLIIRDKYHEKWAQKFMEEEGKEYVRKIEEELLKLQRNSYEEIPSWLQPLKNDAPF